MTRFPAGIFWRPATGRNFALVVLGAALWGTDNLFRTGLALELPASSIVFFDHLLPVALILPLVIRGTRRALRQFGWRDWATIIIIGCGSSALATALFTLAFTYGNGTTPVLLQQIQPLVAVAGAWLLLRERLRPRFGLFLLAGVAGAYLVAFASPTHLTMVELQPALLAVGAAVLWGLGTVLGRRLSAMVPFGELTGLRLGFGLLAAAAVTFGRGEASALVHATGEEWLALVCLAIFPGVLSLLIYYRGLRGTPAAAATLGELAFPLTSTIIGYTVLHDVLSRTQWLGVALLCLTVVLMGTIGRRGRAVEVPELVAARASRRGGLPGESSVRADHAFAPEPLHTAESSHALPLRAPDSSRVAESSYAPPSRAADSSHAADSSRAAEQLRGSDGFS